jgi:hypothetical protein
MKLNRLFASNILVISVSSGTAVRNGGYQHPARVPSRGFATRHTILIKLAVDSVVGFHGYDTILGFSSVTFFYRAFGYGILLKAICSSTDQIVSLIQRNFT